MSRTIDRAQAVALSLHSWNNTSDDWKRLQEVVTRLGKGAPKEARAALARHLERSASLPNPFDSRGRVYALDAWTKTAGGDRNG